MYHLYLSLASEVASSMTGMFDQLGVRSRGLSNGRVQAEENFPSPMAVNAQWQVLLGTFPSIGTAGQN